MTSPPITRFAVVKAFDCPDCGAKAGDYCRNRKGKSMGSVHPKRMRCPICKDFYQERSGNGFRHWSVSGNKWCRLPRKAE